ncbi:hypothetical protein C2R22_14825 [Salinigranum rubrum]|uniref:Metal-dependent hydrolase n=1 Tax=Salinigranum rubrum TaxID=755307 RepID=A0A2I8VLG7_9EURY|nr:hypothetical protein [Salinigranum rubrum]AUV82761.1 hypothetical protein C2R22_14825 [Salinigranum rubrum]
MSLWGVHVGVAGIVTVLVLFALAPGHRYRGVVVAASSLWAVLPDFHHALVWFPALQTDWRALHDSALANLFWLHRVIDRADPGDRVVYSLAMWGLFLAVVASTELAIRRRR